MPYEPTNLGPNQHLGYGRGPDGGKVGLIFENGTNKLVGHAVWEEVDGDSHHFQQGEPHEPPKLTPEQKIIADALAQVLTQAIIELTPVVKRWWEDSLLPAAKSAIKRLVESIKTKRRGSIEQAEPSLVYIATKTDPTSTIAEAPVTMTKAEWSTRYQAVLDASQFSAEQRRLLSVARIVEAEGDPEATLTPREFSERIRLKIEANPAVLEEQNAAKVVSAIVDRRAIEA